jgi:trehalose/maltose hydrolase-like predicted phosphorylase
MANRKIKDWQLIYPKWEPQQQPLREALCALGNGYLVTRGSFEESHAGGCHYPGTYLAGGYNRLKTDIAGHVLENESLVNWPNWLTLTFRPEGGDWFNLQDVEVLDFQFCLDIYQGVLERQVRFRDADEREFSLTSRRLVSMANPHLAAIEWRLMALNWSGQIEILSTLDGTVTNQNVERYRQLNSQHLEPVLTDVVGEDAILLTVRTTQSHICMAQAARTHVYEGDEQVASERHTERSAGRISQQLRFPCHQHQELRIEKVVAIHTSRDFAISDPSLAVRQAIHRVGTFTDLLHAHTLQWSHLWSITDIELQDCKSETQLILRLHLFHLLQTTSTNTIDRDVGVPSRGWHGEAYRGHILWDELFIFPLLTLRLTELARSLLMYRYRRLDEARHLANQAGYGGAMYPWQSGSDGREESQVLHLNPRSGRWVPDNSNIQRHVNAAIAYNVWQYYQATNDKEFMAYYGAEMLLEIARFWASMATYNAERDRYEIKGVMGPDEFHTRYPGSDSPGLNNNAYTNVMAVWVLNCAARALDLLDDKRRREVIELLAIDDEELVRWQQISKQMFIPFHEDDIISQFEGYGDLKEFDWVGYQEKYGDVQRLDRILEAEQLDVNEYKASKQADVLMLFYLFSSEKLQELFEQMGYEFDSETIPRNIHYYLDRTSHGSTLSRVVHSWVLGRSDRERAWKLFEEALHSDIEDIQGGTTPEGIHLGAMAGTVDLIQRMYTGLEMREEVLWFNPVLPQELTNIHLPLRYRGHWLSIRLNHETLTVSFERGGAHPAHIGFRDQVYEMCQGECQEFALTD